MKSISKIMTHSFCSILLLLMPVAMAATGDSAEAARITEALERYAQAVPMEMDSPERGELLKSAESILRDVIEKNPHSLDAHRKLMGVYLQMRDYRQAVQTMQSAISLSPEDPKLFIALAILYDHQGAYEYAAPILDQALVLDPNSQMARDYKAKIEQKIEKRKLAMESANPGPQNEAEPHSR
jgi:tetratricopeptide (TPR) repeat protein